MVSFIARLVNRTSDLNLLRRRRTKVKTRQRDGTRQTKDETEETNEKPDLGQSPHRSPPPRACGVLTPPPSPGLDDPDGSNDSNGFGLARPVDPQLRSPLFNLVPPEIRSLVWAEVVGNGIVHIILQEENVLNWRTRGWPVPGRLSHVVCYCEDAEDWWRHECIVQAWDGPCPYVGRTRCGRRADGGKLDLLVSCRRIYEEAISLLYTTNVFDLNDSGGGSNLRFPLMLDFAASILPRRLAAIRHLQLRFHHHHNQHRNHDHDNARDGDTPTSTSLDKWQTIVAILKRDMPGLDTLKLEISTEKPAMGLGHGGGGWGGNGHGGAGAVATTATATSRVDERALLGPLADIVHVSKSFVVDVNWIGGTESDEDDGNQDGGDEEEGPTEWPFVLRRLTHR